MAGQDKLASRASERDIEQATLLFHPSIPLREVARELAITQAREKHGVELQSLRLVHRDNRNARIILLEVIDVARKSSLLSQVGKRGTRIALTIIPACEERDQFIQMLEARGVGAILLAQP